MFDSRRLFGAATVEETLMTNSRTRMRNLALAATALLALLVTAAPAHAQLDIRGGEYTDVNKPFVGAGLFTHAGKAIYLNPNVEYVFVDNGKFGSANFDVLLHLPTGSSPTLYAGGGLALVYTNPDGPAESETLARANVIAGVGFGGKITPYLQGKYISGYKYWALTAGLRF